MSYEQNIKEARTLEAMKNGYMGLEGKFSQITKKLGSPIIRQGGLYADSTSFEDIFEDEEDQIKTMNEDEPTFEVGRQFDGLSKGVNLSIIIIHHLREITVRFEGQIVYKEISGELESYSPNKVWEDWISRLYDSARKLHRAEIAQLKKESNETKNYKSLKILEELRKKWGI